MLLPLLHLVDFCPLCLGSFQEVEALCLITKSLQISPSKPVNSGANTYVGVTAHMHSLISFSLSCRFNINISSTEYGDKLNLHGDRFLLFHSHLGLYN